MSIDAAVDRAELILGGAQTSPDELAQLSESLTDQDQFNLCRKLLDAKHALAQGDPQAHLRLGLYKALCTYQDSSLPVRQRLDLALTILGQIQDLATTRNEQTLKYAGAVHKRKWELDGNPTHLYRSLHYYLRGYQGGAPTETWHCGINAAFVSSLIADAETEAFAPSDGPARPVAKYDKIANEIRSKLVEVLPPLWESHKSDKRAWGLRMTIAEAYFGLGEYDEAAPWLDWGDWKKAPWSARQRYARQLAEIARLNERVSGQHHSAPMNLLAKFLGSETAAKSVLLGKVGIALSGGGFRASLFHIGVLAKLAELDVLRHVELLSCVSGGSIVGAHYYLALRLMLQATPDGDVTRDMYINLIERIIAYFPRAVQANVRTRLASSFWKNIARVFNSTSYTQYLSGLLDEFFFGRSGSSMGSLVIKPLGWNGEFDPKAHNWQLAAKIPLLVLNATSLNTGHNWQFTAERMGEPPNSIDPEVDGNYRLRRMPNDVGGATLANAVAASASVPGLFEPLTLGPLYGGITVRLSDGGVHDNQGISALLDGQCTILIVSDASGQTGTEASPPSNPFDVSLRANDILMARVRAAQYRELTTLRQASLLRGLAFVHLKKDLPSVPIDWIGCSHVPEQDERLRQIAQQEPLTSYGIRRDIQQLLSSVRTDLDSFSEVEAYALMTSGYKMIEQELRKPEFAEVVAAGVPGVHWEFLKILPCMAALSSTDPCYLDLRKQLEVSRRRAFKIFGLYGPLRILLRILLILCIFAIIGTVLEFPRVALMASGGFVAVILTILLIVWSVGAAGLGRARDWLWRTGFAMVMCVPGWVGSNIHLRIFDPWFLKRCSLQRLLSLRRTSTSSVPPAPLGE